MALTKTIRIVNILLVLAFILWVASLWLKTEAAHTPEKPKAPEQVQDAHELKSKVQAPPVQMVLPTPPAPKVAPTRTAQQRGVENVRSEEPITLKKADPQPAPDGETKAEPALKAEPIKPKLVPVTLTQAAEGRALLKVLEHGKGPLIEIAWPTSAQQRQRLYDLFTGCYGMQTAVMDRAGDLYRADEPPFERWEINLDRYSGFLREASGKMSRSETRAIEHISRKHDVSQIASKVRIFPRSVDARLLGGLQAMVGEGYMKASNIQARYGLQDDQVFVEALRIDGLGLSGRIAMSPLGRCT